METLLEELTSGLPSAVQVTRIVVRLTAAALLAAVVGFQREQAGKPAGMRTHMLVAVGAALFVLGPQESGMSMEDLSRVIQGLTTGIGFIGGGAILKLSREREIQGLTTAASLWMTAAVGVAVGLGRIGMAMVSVTLAWIILELVGIFENRIQKKIPNPEKP